jgi:predicted PurR-regulated permease PerM
MNTKKYVNMAIVILVYTAFATILWPFKQAIFFAILFSFALNPLLVKLKSKSFKKKHLTDFKAISFLVISLVGIFLLPVSIVFIKAVNAISQIDTNKISELPVYQKISDTGISIFNSANELTLKAGFDLSTQIDIKGFAAEAGKNALSFGSSVLTNVPSAIFQFLIFIVMLYYFLLNQKRLTSSLVHPGLLTQNQVDSLVNLFEGVCHLVLLSTLMIAFLQAVIVSTASAIVGFEGSLIIFMIAFFMAFIPVVGSAPLTVSLIIYSALNGHYIAMVVLAVAAGLAGLLDNVIKTYLFSSKEDSVSPVISLLSLIGSLSIFGILGLFLGPIISALAVKIGKIINEE